MTYQEWIDQVTDVYGTCEEVTKEMVKNSSNSEESEDITTVLSGVSESIGGLSMRSTIASLIQPKTSFHPREQGPMRNGMVRSQPVCVQTAEGEYMFNNEQVHNHCHDEFVRSLM